MIGGRWLALFGMGLFLVRGVGWAQVSMRGQVFLPSGDPIHEVIRLTLKGDDPRRDVEFIFTDGQGRFILQGLTPLRTYTLTIDGDGRRYATTTVTFIAQPRGYVPVNLLPLEAREAPPRPGVVSVSHLKRDTEAVKLYREALEEIERGKLASAEEKLRKAIKRDAEFVEAYNELAVLQMGKKAYAEAERWLRRALEKDPEALHPLLNLGICLNYLGRHRDALAPLRRVLEHDPAWVTAHVHLGIALLESDLLEEAEPHLLRGTQAEGLERALAYLYLGKLYAQTGHIPKAVEAWKTYLEMDPNSPNAERIRALLVQLGYPPK
ncbi:Lipopolysaccharide assembly protein B [bacterium HR08]|nr:Lipopolysaccharide assembly protein B [bacterium HR08]